MKLFPVYGLVAIILIDNTLSTRNNANNRHEGRAGRVEQVTADERETGQCATNRPTCQNFQAVINSLINAQIREELNASYVYQSMAMYFGRDDQALRGFAKFFQASSDEEREHAQKLMDYLNKRGGDIELFNITKPASNSWGSGLEAMSTALQLERHVNDKLLDLHYVASHQNDPHLTNFLESYYLTEQVDSIKQLSDFVRILTRLDGNALGELMFDEELHEGKR